MSSSDNEFGKEIPDENNENLPESSKDAKDELNIEPVPPLEQEDMPGIAVHLPEDKKRNGLNPRAWYAGLSPKGRRAAKIAGGTALTLGLLAVATPIVWLHFNKLPDISKIETYAPVESIKIYDRFDRLAAVVSGEEDRRVVPISQISSNMQRAMVAAEDHDFYKHGGINPSSIARAAIVNFQAGRIVEGGSTITQQLVKNIFFPGEKRTINRKIKEFFLANDVDRKYSKNKILEMYLNQIYFGNQSYGIEAAAQRYFNKPASKLTLAESAFIAGLVKAPSFLSNPANRDEAITRQRHVLDDMATYNLASAQEVAAAKQQELHFRHFVSPFQKYPFYISYVMDVLRDNYDEQQLRQGLKVYTSMDPQAQALAEKTLEAGIKHAPVPQGALVSVKVSDGSVLALVGGVGGFQKHQWNRAVTPHTMGSSFKPFVYLTGFLKGLTPDTIVLDSPVSYPSGGQIYTPRNFEGGFKGPLPIRMALAWSRNVCAVRVAAFDGIKNVINTARLCGITARLEPYLPTAIGAGAASPLEMAGAYSVFAGGGVQITPHVLRRVESNDGKLLTTFQPQPKRIFPAEKVAYLVDAMQTVVQKGTAMAAKLPDRPVAGKTGTSDKARDVWFIGYTPDTVTATWGGSDHEKMHGHNVTGGMVMAGIWKNYMQGYYKLRPTPPGKFQAPPQSSQIAFHTVDEAAALQRAGKLNAMLASAETPDKKASDKKSDSTTLTAATNDATSGAVSADSKPAKRKKLIARKLDTVEQKEVELTSTSETKPASEEAKADESKPAAEATKEEAKSEAKAEEKGEAKAGEKAEAKTETKVEEKMETTEKKSDAPFGSNHFSDSATND